MWLSCSQKRRPCLSSIWNILAIYSGDYNKITYSFWKSLKVVDYVDFCDDALIHVVECDLSKFPRHFIWSGSFSIFLSQSQPGLLSYVVLSLERSEELLARCAKVVLEHLKLFVSFSWCKSNMITLIVILIEACTFLCTRYALCATWYLVPY